MARFIRVEMPPDPDPDGYHRLGYGVVDDQEQRFVTFCVREIDAIAVAAALSQAADVFDQALVRADEVPF